MWHLLALVSWEGSHSLLGFEFSHEYDHLCVLCKFKYSHTQKSVEHLAKELISHGRNLQGHLALVSQRGRKMCHLERVFQKYKPAAPQGYDSAMMPQEVPEWVQPSHMTNNRVKNP